MFSDTFCRPQIDLDTFQSDAKAVFESYFDGFEGLMLAGRQNL
jgi:hypothetical protein